MWENHGNMEKSYGKNVGNLEFLMAKLRLEDHPTARVVGVFQ